MENQEISITNKIYVMLGLETRNSASCSSRGRLVPGGGLVVVRHNDGDSADPNYCEHVRREGSEWRLIIPWTRVNGR